MIYLFIHYFPNYFRKYIKVMSVDLLYYFSYQICQLALFVRLAGDYNTCAESGSPAETSAISQLNT